MAADEEAYNASTKNPGVIFISAYVLSLMIMWKPCNGVSSLPRQYVCGRSLARILPVRYSRRSCSHRRLRIEIMSRGYVAVIYITGAQSCNW